MDERQVIELELYDNSYKNKLLELFLKERVALVTENHYPLMLTTDPMGRFVMHLIPEKFYKINFDINQLANPENYCPPIGAKEGTIIHEYNFDGMLFFSIRHEKRRYTQVFRNGIVENAVVILQDQPKIGNYISLFKLEKNLKNSLKIYLKVYEKFSIPGPYYLFMRLLGVENYRLNPIDVAQSGYDPKGVNKALLHHKLILPVYRFENINANIDEILLPFFNILWNTFGFPGVPNLNG